MQLPKIFKYGNIVPSNHNKLSLRGHNICVLDVETTGGSPYVGDRVVEIGLVKLDSIELEITDVFSTLVNPQRPVGATFVHGITEDDVLNAPTFSDIAHEVLNFMSGCVIVGHNLRFDESFLAAEYFYIGEEIPTFPALCTLQLSRKILIGLESYKLTSLAQDLSLYHPLAHVAVGDSIVTAKLMTCLITAVREGFEIALPCLPPTTPNNMRISKAYSRVSDEELKNCFG